MTIAEKIQYAADKKVVTFFKEGLFYKCYNEDAMVFAQKVKNYKVSSKFVKSIGNDVLSLGFPISEVEKRALSLEFISEKINSVSVEEKENNIVFLLRDEHLKNGYQEWITSIESTNKNKLEEPHADYKCTLNYERIISEIKKYDLANTTPMQSFGFIQQLKENVAQIEAENGII